MTVYVSELVFCALYDTSFQVTLSSAVNMTPVCVFYLAEYLATSYSMTDTGIRLDGRHYIVAYVKGSANAHFGIRENNNDNRNMYEILLGGGNNGYSSLRDGHPGSTLDTNGENNIISEQEYRPFWFAFQEGNIMVGKGLEVGVNTFLSHKDPTPFTIRYLYVYSWSGFWASFKFPVGMYFYPVHYICI